MNKLYSTDATYKAERIDNNTVKVTLYTGDGVTFTLYGESYSEVWDKLKQDRDSGMLGKEQAR